MPYVAVSKYVKKKLDVIKRVEQHKTYDSVIRMLIMLWELRREREKIGGEPGATVPLR